MALWDTSGHMLPLRQVVLKTLYTHILFYTIPPALKLIIYRV